MGENSPSKKPLIKREFSAGGVVYKKLKVKSEKLKVLWLITKMATLPKSFHPPNTWRLPKGWLDDAGEMIPGPFASGKEKASEEDLQRAALREVAEEGGVEATIVEKIGTIKFFFNSTRGKVLKFVTFYLMEWIKDNKAGFDDETSEIAWLPYEEARKKLSYSSEKQVLDKAKEILERPRQENLI